MTEKSVLILSVVDLVKSILDHKETARLKKLLLLIVQMMCFIVAQVYPSTTV